MLSSRNGRFSFFPAGRNPKKGDAICSFSLFSSALSLTKYFTCKWCFLFVFKKKERTSFVPATELLEELAHLMSNYRVFTVYTRQWQVEKAQGHSLGEPATPGLNDHPTSLLETLQVLPSPVKVMFRILRRGGGWGLRGVNPTGPNETKPPCDALCCFSAMFSAVVLIELIHVVSGLVSHLQERADPSLLPFCRWCGSPTWFLRVFHHTWSKIQAPSTRACPALWPHPLPAPPPALCPPTGFSGRWPCCSLFPGSLAFA